MKQLSIYETDLLYDAHLNTEKSSFLPSQPSYIDTDIGRKQSSKTKENDTRALSEGNASDNAAADKATRVTEIILSRDMANNLQLVLPMLAHLNQDNRWLAWINPPIQLLKQWQHKPGLSTDDIMVLRSDEKTSEFDLAKKALKAGSCHAVIVWSDQLSQNELDHLDTAAQEGKSHGIVLRYR